MLLKEEEVKIWIANGLVILGLALVGIIVVTINPGLWKYFVTALAMIMIYKGVRILTGR
jgi:4-hydroxybenzoate polyprenyltransferase